MRINLQVIADNIPTTYIKITEIVSDKTSNIVNAITQVCVEIPYANFDVNSVKAENVSFGDIKAISKSDVFIVNDLLGNERVSFEPSWTYTGDNVF